MKLTVIGCSGSFPGPDSSASCYLLEADQDGRTWRVLLDLGSGSLGVLQQYADPLSIDAVLISHLHADHCLDFSGYYVMRKYHPDGAQPKIPVYGPSDTAGRLARGYDLPEDPGMTEEFDFHAWAPGSAVEIGPFRVEPYAVEHPVESYGLRVTADGATLAYTGDTAVCDVLPTLAGQVDLLLAEASFVHGEDNPAGIHLSGHDCGVLAEQSGAHRLVITHVPPWHDKESMLAEARAVWDGPSELAHTGATYELPRRI